MNIYNLKVFTFTVQGRHCVYMEGTLNVRSQQKWSEIVPRLKLVSLSRTGKDCLFNIHGLHHHKCWPVFETEAGREVYILRVCDAIRRMCDECGWTYQEVGGKDGLP